MKKIITLALAVLMITAMAVVVCAADTENWVVGNGFNLVDAEKNVVANNSPVTATEKSATVIDVTHGGYYQDGANWGGVASKAAYALEDLTVKVSYNKVPAVDVTTDCWMYIGLLTKPQMFQVGDIPGNPGYVNLIRFAGKKLEVYDGVENFKNVETTKDATELFDVKAGDCLTVQFIKNAEGLYQVKYTKGNLTYTTAKTFDFDKLFADGKAYVVASASRIASDKDAFAYTVEVNPAPAAPEVSVFLDGARINFPEQAPAIVNEKTLVPLRAIFEALGATVAWDDATKTVTAVRGQDTIKLSIGDTKLYKNGEVAYELDVPAQIMGSGFTMVPVRAISESFGCKVDWVAALRAVVITAK